MGSNLVTAIGGIKLSNDLAMIVNHQYEQLFNKFEHLVMKSFGEFNRSAPLQDKMDQDEYKGFAYEQFAAAADKVNINMIPKEKWVSWGFYFQFSGYLRAYNASMLHKSLDRANREASTETEESKTIDIPFKSDAYEEKSKSDFWTAYKSAYNKLTNEQKVIWDGKLRSRTVTEICTELGLSSYRYNKILKESKVVFENELKNFGLEFSSFLK